MFDSQSTIDYGDGQGGTGQEARLVVIRGPEVGKVCELEQDELRIGRLPGNDLVLASDTVSRQHAVLRRTPLGWTIEDLGSHNGVLHNTYRIRAHTQVRLSHKDTVQFSDVLLLFLSGAMDKAQQQTISEIPINIAQAEKEGNEAVDEFLRSIRSR